MQQFTITAEQKMSLDNRGLLHYLRESLGFIPNIFALLTKSEHALRSYLHFQQRKTLLTKKEKEVVSLVISQFNGDRYGQAVHTMIGKWNGFTEDELIAIRMGRYDADKKIEVLARISREIAVENGSITTPTLQDFFAAGYREGHLVDLVMTIGEKTILNYLWKIMRPPIDFPTAAEIPPSSDCRANL